MTLRGKDLGVDEYTEGSASADRLHEAGKNLTFEEGGKAIISDDEFTAVEEEKGEDLPSGVGSEIIERVKDAKERKVSLEEEFDWYDRDFLGAFVKDITDLKAGEREREAYFARGPPNEFYVNDVKEDGSYELVKLDYKN